MRGSVAPYASCVTGRPDDEEGGGDGTLEGRGPARLRVSRSLSIPLTEIDWRASTPGGPGGQHANKTASRVEVSFDVDRSATLGPRQRARLLERLGPVVRAVAADERSQARNRQIALERLAARIAEGLRVAPTRRPTRPTKGSKERRLADKHRRGEVKRGRRPGADADD
jgi:ribosome-associated protein